MQEIGEDNSQIINEKDKILENQSFTVEEEEPKRKLNHIIHKVSKVIQKKKHKFSNHTKPITISNLKSKFNVPKFGRVAAQREKVDEQKSTVMDFRNDQECEREIVQFFFEEDNLFEFIGSFYQKKN